jgi:hypothetical protein
MTARCIPIPSSGTAARPVDRHMVPPDAVGRKGAVAWFITAIPVARDGRDKGRKAISGE